MDTWDGYDDDWHVPYPSQFATNILSSNYFSGCEAGIEEIFDANKEIRHNEWHRLVIRGALCRVPAEPCEQRLR